MTVMTSIVGCRLPLLGTVHQSVIAAIDICGADAGIVEYALRTNQHRFFTPGKWCAGRTLQDNVAKSN